MITNITSGQFYFALESLCLDIYSYTDDSGTPTACIRDVDYNVVATSQRLGEAESGETVREITGPRAGEFVATALATPPAFMADTDNFVNKMADARAAKRESIKAQ